MFSTVAIVLTTKTINITTSAVQPKQLPSVTEKMTNTTTAFSTPVCVSKILVLLRVVM